ncbi:MAG: HAD family hydrolase [Candidatus Heimdallarchaeaceae archaeon]
MKNNNAWNNYAILCDMDGVIISIKERWVKPFEQILSRIAPNFDRSKVEASISSLIMGYGGKKKLLMVRVLYQICKLAGLSRLQIFRVYVTVGFALLFGNKFKIVPIEGVFETLLLLKDAGFKLALVSSASNFTIKRLKKHHPELYDLFDVVLTRKSVELTKPFPDQLELALKKLNVAKSNAVMVGDLITDIFAGKNAGIKTVAVLCEFPDITKTMLEAANPDFLIPCFKDILKILPELFEPTPK